MFSFFSVLKVTQVVKRIFAILMLIVFLFNGIGYYGLFYLTRNYLRSDMRHKLDAGNYTDNQTVTLKIPFTLPYQLNTNFEYERINGSFQFQGEFYKLIKQKHVNDTLYIVCLRDSEEKHLNTVVTDFVKITNALPASSKTLKLLQGFIKEFEPGYRTEIEIHPQSVVAILLQANRPYVVLQAIDDNVTPPPESLL